MAVSKEKAMAAKARGIQAFKKKNFSLAVECFSEAIEHDPTDKTLYSNRAAAYTTLGKKDNSQYDKAIEDGKKVIELDADWGKGYSRLALALFSKKEYAECVKVYAQGIAKDPSNKQLTAGLQAAQEKLKKTASDDSDECEVGEEKADDSTHAVGIDLGTTYSCVAVWKGDGVEIIPNSLGDRTTPSYVGWSESGERLIGQPAKNAAARNPTNTVFDIKRIIGQRFDDSGVEKDVSGFPFKVVRGPNDKPVTELTIDGEKKQFAPEEISAMVLRNLKETAESYLGNPVTKAVVTVPAYFNDAQRKATKAAGAIAGLEVLRIINEPTAAALAYGIDGGCQKTSHVMIFDLGGGTFDVSLLRISNGLFEVMATGGDTRLGGEDFDSNVVDFFVKEAARQGMKDIEPNSRPMRRLRVAAERAKRILSNSTKTEVEVESLVDGQDFALVFTRAKFESLNRALFARCMETVGRVLRDAAPLKQKEVTEVVLVGGSTRIPKIQKDLQEFFGGKDLCKSLNPDEAVAYGAAVQAGILSGKKSEKTKNVLLMDVAPLSLGIETVGGVMSPIIKRNTHVPCVKRSIYTTEEDYQTCVDVCIYEGERMKTEHNNLLGKFEINGIQRAKRGEPQVEVAFEIDADGILTVTATDLVTNAKANITVSNRNQSTPEDIERMVEDAKRHEAKDREELEKVDASNDLQRTILKVFESAKARSTVPRLRATLEQAANDAQDWLDAHAESAPSAEIRSRERQLQRRIQAQAAL